jgi:hypothetical protein
MVLGMSATEATMVFTAFTALFTGVAAVGAWWSARMTRKAAEAGACIQVADRYELESMSRSLRILRTSKRHTEDTSTWTARWLSAMHKEVGREDWAVDLDNARRQVTGYFFWLGRLYRGGMVTKSFVRTAGSVAGIKRLLRLLQTPGARAEPR